MMALTLPPRPSLDWLRKTAKDHLRELRSTHPETTLAEAQRDVAREYGFPSWRALKAQVDGLASASSGGDDDAVRRFFARVGGGDAEAVRAAIAAGSRGSALHSAAWEGDLPMARLLVEAGADARARDPEHGNTPAGWARVAAEVTSNPRCADVADYLDSVTPQAAAPAENGSPG